MTFIFFPPGNSPCRKPLEQSWLRLGERAQGTFSGAVNRYFSLTPLCFAVKGVDFTSAGLVLAAR